MTKYTAELFRNAREVLFHDFEAADDAAARKYITENTESYGIDWIDSEECDSDCGASDRLIDLRRESFPDSKSTIGSLDTVEEAIRLKSEMPYSWDAREFVRKVATISDRYANENAALRAFVEEARKLCGMET